MPYFYVGLICFALGVLVSYLYRKTRTPHGEFIIRQDSDGSYSYTLKLEEEPEGLHGSRYIFFKVKKSH